VTRHSIPSGRARLVVDATGDGDALLMIHAGVTDRSSWEPLIARIGDGMRAIRYDARGYGETAYETEDGWSPVTDAAAVLDGLGIDRAIVIGCSMGGRTAIDLALAHPDRVAALVLIAPAVGGAPAPVLDPIVAELDRQMDEANAAGDLEEVNRLESIVWLDGPDRPGRAAPRARELFLAMNGIALHAPDPGEQLVPDDAWKRLDEIAVPTLVLVGDLDLAHVRRNSQQVAAAVPGAELVELGDVAHLPHLEAHAAALDTVAEFLGR